MSDYWVETRSGRAVDLLRPAAEDISLDDVAHGLSHVCRFAGQCERFYSVAEHSVHMAQYVLRSPIPHSNVIALAALFHDAHEAYTGDVPRPVKGLLSGLRELQYRLDRAVQVRFGLPSLYSTAWVVVGELDARILVDERAQLMSPTGNVWPTDGLEPLGVALSFWEPREAAWRFRRLALRLLA